MSYEDDTEILTYEGGNILFSDNIENGYTVSVINGVGYGILGYDVDLDDPNRPKYDGDFVYYSDSLGEYKANN